MLDARDDFQAAGWYRPLERAIARIISAENPRRILDVGCGTGYYVRGVLGDAQADSVRALGMDLSPAAVARTVRSSDAVDGLVADVWSPLPIRDGAADVVLNVFAPRNAGEFHRVLRPGGLLLVVVPRQTHLQELRAAGLALDIQPDKAAHLTASLGARFALECRETLSDELALSGRDIAALIGMGPSAHHTDPSEVGSAAEGVRCVTAAFDLFSFRRRDS
ncbi:methyltransferase domain-containing protein [Cryobacterium sp. MLB-32]|uniref:methyltransferase domain-containing protein n=1 Tax=Cryobacterium sp. MLB-32 TaxID=1529318 RepID=UPI000B030082|nr:methyltransferase domain-containing protein [Cryobacterium sp. MLB-32]